MAGVAYADGFFGTVAAPNPPGPSLAQFLVLRRQFEPNDKLSSYVAGSYDAAMLLMLARAQAGSDDPTEVRDALLRVSSDSSGDLVGPADVPAACTRAAWPGAVTDGKLGRAPGMAQTPSRASARSSFVGTSWRGLPPARKYTAHAASAGDAARR